MLRESQTLSFEDAMARIARSKFSTVARLYASEDHTEGARAFAEKRAPRWQGR